ncbi:MAG: DUF445 family protein [Balneolaceae bacterium]
MTNSNKSTEENKTEHFRPVYELGKVLGKHLNLNLLPKTTAKDFQRPKKSEKSLRILSILKPIPWILITLFVFSFVWDFNELSLTLFELNLPLEGLLRILSVSGLIGFLTNWIAITMLFRPLNKRPLLGQGLIPAHKERIAFRLASAVSEDLINPDLIRKKIEESKNISLYRERFFNQIADITSQPEFRDDLKTWLMKYVSSVVDDPAYRKKVAQQITTEVEGNLENKPFEKAALKTYSFLKGQQLHDLIEETLTRLPESVNRNIDAIDDYIDEFPDRLQVNHNEIDEVISNVLFKLINQLDVQNLVEENLRTYDEKKLESMIRNATNEQLKTIQYLGAILGTVGGFVIWQPAVSLTILAIIFAGIWILDRQLFQIQND